MTQALAGFAGALKETGPFQTLPQAPCSRGNSSHYVSLNVPTIFSILTNSDHILTHTAWLLPFLHSLLLCHILTRKDHLHWFLVNMSNKTASLCKMRHFGMSGSPAKWPSVVRRKLQNRENWNLEKEGRKRILITRATFIKGAHRASGITHMPRADEENTRSSLGAIAELQANYQSLPIPMITILAGRDDCCQWRERNYPGWHF